MKVLADPVAWSWLALLVTALVLLGRRRRKPGWLILAVFLLASLLQLIRFPEWLLAGLERPYLKDGRWRMEDGKGAADAVVVLGGYGEASTNALSGIEFNDRVDRILTGLALVREGKGRVLVLGGGGRGNPPQPAEARAAAKWMRSWNLAPVPVEILGPCKDTHDEALHTSSLARTNGWKKILLVTSAWHMRRALATFRKAGLEASPVGSDFRGTVALAAEGRWSFIPRSEGLVLLDLWLEEVFGHIYYWARGWV
jgi:uncharacterized SAM-binding protein YcdF (DUF218 family)